MSIKSLFDLDRLNPIIVKEVRQGNRSKAFLLNFMLAQISMLFFVIVVLSNASSGSGADVKGMNIGFWTILGIFLIAGVPLTGFNAINQERSEARLDLLHLTRLSAMRIVTGKWLALISQSFLITSSIIPYVICRYYFGGINVVSDLLTIGVLLGLSAVLSGLSISLSCLKSKVIRFIFIFVMVWFSASLALGFAGSAFLYPGKSYGYWLTFFAVLIEAIFLLVLALKFSASTIAPMAENHQSQMRVWYLLQLTFLVLLSFFADNDLLISVSIFVLILGIFVVIVALVKEPVSLSSVYQPFVKKGRLGKFVGYFLLYPGYPSALYYTTFCVLFFFCGHYTMVQMPHLLELGSVLFKYYAILIPTILSCFFLPLALALRTSSEQFSLATRYIGYVLIFILLGSLSATLAYTQNMAVSYVSAILPFSNLVLLLGNDFDKLNIWVYSLGSTVSLSFSLVYLLRKGSAWRLREKELEFQAGQLISGEEVRDHLLTEQLRTDDD